MQTSQVGCLGAAAVLAAAVVSGCGSAQMVVAKEASCVTCHGGLDNDTGAPPVGLDGKAAGPLVGAHTTHLQAGVACESCHVVPAPGVPGHPAGTSRAVVTFGGLAVAGSPADRARTGPPVYDPATLTCSAVYCHGGTLDAGGSVTAPSWGEQLPNCGTCHGFAPPSHAKYANRLDCNQCHALSVEPDNQTLKPAHLNGRLDFDFPVP